MKREMAMFTGRSAAVRDGKIVPILLDPVEVRVMVRAESYAMVRRKGCVPFVCSEKDLDVKEDRT